MFSLHTLPQTTDHAAYAVHGPRMSVPRIECPRLHSPQISTASHPLIRVTTKQYWLNGTCTPVSGDASPLIRITIHPLANNRILSPFTGKQVQWLAIHVRREPYSIRQSSHFSIALHNKGDHMEKSMHNYWKRNKTYMLILLAIWALVSYVFGIFFVEQLNAFHLGGFPLGFWFAQQGSIYVFVLIILAYFLLMDRLDKKFDVHE